VIKRSFLSTTKNLGEKRILFGEIDEVGYSEPYSCC